MICDLLFSPIKCFISLVVFVFFNNRVNCTITETRGTYYIRILDDTNTYNWFYAKDYCSRNYGTSLASVHSDEEESDLASILDDSGDRIWIGYNDMRSEGTWIWTDGSINDEDFEINWNDGEPNNSGGDQHCANYYPSSGTFKVDDTSCFNTNAQFACNIETSPYEEWQPIFKISDNLADFGGQSNTYNYWMYGTNNYDSLQEELAYINGGTFNEATIDTTNNFRSVLFDSWSVLHSTLNIFDKIKIAVYSNDVQVSYWIFDATDDLESWFSWDNMIDSNYYDATYDTSTSFLYFGLDAQTSIGREWMIWKNYGGCANDNGWLIVVHDANCGNWAPGEAATVPQIRYSINSDDSSYTSGLQADSSQNEVADTMVVSINLDLSELNTGTPDCITAKFLDDEKPSSGWYCLSRV